MRRRPAGSAACSAPLIMLSSAASRPCGDSYVELLKVLLGHRFIVPSIAVAGGGQRCGAVHPGRARLLPGDRRRPHPAPCARAGRHAHRGHRAAVPGDRGQDPRGHPRARPRADRRQYRPAGAALQSRLHRRLDDRRQRRRHPGGAEGRPRADRRLCAQAPARTAGRLPASRLLLPGGRHGDPDPEFRPAGADRRAHRGLRPGQQPQGRPRAAAAPGDHTGHRRCAPAAGGRRARLLRRRSTARGRPSSASAPAPSPTTSMSA